jgi:O-antigen/teichoic acid export membrane protein
MGIWQTARLIPNYAGFLSIGTPFYFTREVPKLRGKGDFEKIELIRQTIFTYNYLLFLPILAGIISYMLIFNPEYDLKIAVLATIIIIFVSTFTSLNEFLLKGESRFIEISKIKYFNIPLLLINLGLLFWFGFIGFLIGQILVNLANSVYYFIIKKYPIKFSFNYKIWKDSVRVGFPISVEVMIDMIFTTIDRLIIVAFLGFTQVGYYSLTSLMVVPITLFVTSINSVLFVETLNSSSKENNQRIIKRNFVLPSNTLTYVLPYLIAVMNLFLPVIIMLLLPKYADGIIPAQIFVWGMYFYTMTGFFSNTLVSIDKQKVIPVILAISSTINLTLCFIFIYSGFGIIGVSIATAVAYFSHSGIAVFFTHKYYSIENFKSIINKYYLPMLYTIAIYAVLVNINITDNQYLDILFKFTIITLLSLPIIIKGTKNILSLVNSKRLSTA